MLFYAICKLFMRNRKGCNAYSYIIHYFEQCHIGSCMYLQSLTDRKSNMVLRLTHTTLVNIDLQGQNKVLHNCTFLVSFAL